MSADDQKLVAQACTHQPVGTRGNTVGGSSDARVGDLGGVQPRHSEPSDGEEGVEDEEKDSSDVTRGLVACLSVHAVGKDFGVGDGGGGSDGEQSHCDHHTSGTEEHELCEVKRDCERENNDQKDT